MRKRPRGGRVDPTRLRRATGGVGHQPLPRGNKPEGECLPSLLHALNDPRQACRAPNRPLGLGRHAQQGQSGRIPVRTLDGRHPSQRDLPSNAIPCLALVACVPQHVTVAPAPIEDVAAIPVQVGPHLWTLNERWAGGTAGAAPAGTLLRQALVDDPQAPLRLTSVTSRLDVRAVVSPTFYRPRA
jgi:hypothetical protein